MSKNAAITLDGNEAAASVAYRLNEVIAIYPITPSSNMGEWCDEWASKGVPNLQGTVPLVAEMQSEGGASGAVHGSLQAGALTTTFTSSQGLLLMIPNMGKIAGELSPFVMHVAARAIGHNGISIFGDHSDVMACRQTGFAMLASDGVQAAHDFAAIAQAATLRSRVPFLHFFDGFRTSHEVASVERLTDDELRSLVDPALVAAHRARALRPEAPVVRGTTQNSDTFFQTREACTRFHAACPGVVQAEMDRFAALTGRAYRVFEYFGAPDAESVVVLMGSACDTAHEYVEWATTRGEKVGVLKVRLFRPFDLGAFVAALPSTVRRIAVLDRTKEPGASAEPLALDVTLALAEKGPGSRLAAAPLVVPGRYGLAGKEFTPAHVRAVFENLASPAPKLHFTVGIVDDVGGSSLEVDPGFSVESPDVTRALFYGLGADGTVGANKNSIKIIAEGTAHHGQGYFVYDSKKAGSVTVSHLRFGPRRIRSSYLIQKASFVACHHSSFLEKVDMLERIERGGTFLLNTPHAPERVWETLPREVQEAVLGKALRFFVVDAAAVAKETGMGGRINTIMQVCFFAISGVLPREEAIYQIKKSIEKTYGKKGGVVVTRNFEAVDATLACLREVVVPARVTSTTTRPPTVSTAAPAFVRDVTAEMIAGRGDDLPVGAFPPDGTWPVGTSRWEKRNIALEIPIWDAKLCIQCNKCALVCPHAAIRPKVFDAALLDGAPARFRSVPSRGPDHPGFLYALQVAPEDCTGCGICVAACPAKDKASPSRRAIGMEPQAPHREAERESWDFFLGLPDPDRTLLKRDVKGSQLMLPLLEYSGACAGCGETPYLKLLTQLFGDRAVVANATGCSSVYGGNLPTTPYCADAKGRGPAWSNSLFEDNAEFGYGMRLAVDKQTAMARELLARLAPSVGELLAGELLSAVQRTEAGIEEQRSRVAALRERLATLPGGEPKLLADLADSLVRRSLWIVGGDGWAYDIGFGGLDHVLAQGRDVNLLVLDTEVYSNTGGQASKATPKGAGAKFAMGGKRQRKKDLGLMAMAYGNVYVARIAFGARDAQTLTAFLEAESYEGPSLLIAYCHCIAHGYDLVNGLKQQQLAVDSGHWPLYRYDPRRADEGLPALQLDSRPPKVPLSDYVSRETRYRMIEQAHPETYRELLDSAQADVASAWSHLEHLSGGGVRG
ncbi:MAG: pyruvate:ferredoxin (flavodoxin) oxidoreductase [Holophagales bacterium]|nr:pyruvate:ferredoxin (flavodoxin) oxidoreductase [Holophagales bacterium]